MDYLLWTAFSLCHYVTSIVLLLYLHLNEGLNKIRDSLRLFLNIKTFYNSLRSHSGTGWLSPNATLSFGVKTGCLHIPQNTVFHSNFYRFLLSTKSRRTHIESGVILRSRGRDDAASISGRKGAGRAKAVPLRNYNNHFLIIVLTII